MGIFSTTVAFFLRAYVLSDNITTRFLGFVLYVLYSYTMDTLGYFDSTPVSLKKKKIECVSCPLLLLLAK